MVLHAQQPKKRCEQDLLPQGEPSFEPLLSGWGSRLAFKEKPTKPNRRPCKPKRTPYEVAPDLLIPAAAAAADGWLVVWVGWLVWIGDCRLHWSAATKLEKRFNFRRSRNSRFVPKPPFFTNFGTMLTLGASNGSNYNYFERSCCTNFVH